jgi:hypothetical protein
MGMARKCQLWDDYRIPTTWNCNNQQLSGANKSSVAWIRRHYRDRLTLAIWHIPLCSMKADARSTGSAACCASAIFIRAKEYKNRAPRTVRVVGIVGRHRLLASVPAGTVGSADMSKSRSARIVDVALP